MDSSRLGTKALSPRNIMTEVETQPLKIEYRRWTASTLTCSRSDKMPTPYEQRLYQSTALARGRQQTLQSATTATKPAVMSNPRPPPSHNPSKGTRQPTRPSPPWCTSTMVNTTTPQNTQSEGPSPTTAFPPNHTLSQQGTSGGTRQTEWAHVQGSCRGDPRLPRRWPPP